MTVLSDTWLLFKRNMLGSLRNPIWIIIALFQPICYLLLFAPLLDNLVKGPGFPGGGNALAVFVPGLLVMLGIFGSVFVGFGLIAELRAGVVERFRVTPVSRIALPLAAAGRDVVILLVQMTLLLLIAWAMGLQANFGGVVLALVLMGLVGLMLACCSYSLALLVKDENGMASTVNIISVPLLLLSGILLPMTLAPDWLKIASDINPFKHAVEATRSLLAGDFGNSEVLLAFGLVIALAVLALWWAVSSFKEATA